MQEHHEEDQEVYQNHQMQEQDDEMVDEEEEIIPGSHPPQVPEDGTYIDALNEAGVDQARIDQL